MTSEEEPKRLDLTDPKAMRALAHPVRMALLELLSVAGTLTATQASEALGESPANCAFHLRTLAKYGFVAEAGGGKGRERPWRSVPLRIRVNNSQDDPKAEIAANSLAGAWRERWFERARQALGQGSATTDEWREARQATRSLKFLTPEELEELGEQVQQIFQRFAERIDPAERPKGSLPVELLFFGYPLTDLAALSEGAEDPSDQR